MSKNCKKIWVFDENGKYLFEKNSVKELSAFISRSTTAIDRHLSDGSPIDINGDKCFLDYAI